MIRPTRRAILVFLAGVPVALLPAFGAPGAWLLWVAFAAVAVLLLGTDALLALPPRAVRVTVQAPELLFLGEPPETLRARLMAPPEWAVQIRGVLALDALLLQQPEQTATLREGSAQFDFALQPLRRGTARIEALWLRWNGPLGLVDRELRVPLQAASAISPNVRAVRRAALRFFTNRQFLSGLKVEHYLGDGSEFEALREYARGFDRRAMDWKASARHRRLLCREFRAERNHQVVIALDTGHLMREPLEGLARLDHAVNAGLLLGYLGLRSGDRVGVFGFDERVRCWAEPQGGAHTFPRLQHAVAALEYVASETNFTLGLAELSARLRRRSLVVLLTEFTDTVTAELMVENVDRLSRRHLVVFVALQDPGLRKVTDARPRSQSDLYRAVVTADLVRDRELVLLRLRRLGVQVIDAEPGAVSAQLLNRYLEIKRRELV